VTSYENAAEVRNTLTRNLTILSVSPIGEDHLSLQTIVGHSSGSYSKPTAILWADLVAGA
jgi:hypothetical protein